MAPSVVSTKARSEGARIIRGVWAILAGLVVLTFVSFAIEAAVDPFLLRLFPSALPDAAALAGNLQARLLMLAYTTFAIAVGGYVTACIARCSPLAHAAVMGAIELAFTLYVMIAAPFHEAHPAARWLWIASAMLMIPAACLGAAIQAKQARPTTSEIRREIEG